MNISHRGANSPRFIRTEVSEESRHLRVLNESIHMEAARMLELVFGQADAVNQLVFLTASDTLLDKLLLVVLGGKTDVQPYLLSALRNLVNLLGSHGMMQHLHHPSARAMRRRESFTVSAALDSLLLTGTNPAGGADPGGHSALKSVVTSPKLVNTLTEALSNPATAPVLNHWMEFTFHILPHMRAAFKHSLLPLIKCFAVQATLYVRNLEAYVASGLADPAVSRSLDVDMITYIRGLEKIVAFCLVDEDAPPPDQRSDSTSSLFGTDTSGAATAAASAGGTSETHTTSIVWSFTDYVSSVFVGDPAAQESQLTQKTRDSVITLLPNIFRILTQLYLVLDGGSGSGGSVMSPTRFGAQRRQRAASSSSSSSTSSSSSSPVLSQPSAPTHTAAAASSFSSASTSKTSTFALLRKQGTQCVERLAGAVYRTHPGELIEALLVVWFHDNAGGLARASADPPRAEPRLLLPHGSDATENGGNGGGGLDFTAVRLLHAVPGCSHRAVLATVLEGLKARAALANGSVPVREKGKRVPFRSQNL
ncbi:hypothetical protein HK405_013886, partial [Cladochytrium tenue]